MWNESRKLGNPKKTVLLLILIFQFKFKELTKSLHQGRDRTLGNIHGDIIHGEKCVVKVALETEVTFTVSLGKFITLPVPQFPHQ